jgi:hypothetical protein
VSLLRYRSQHSKNVPPRELFNNCTLALPSTRAVSFLEQKVENNRHLAAKYADRTEKAVGSVGLIACDCSRFSSTFSNRVGAFRAIAEVAPGS